MKRLFLILGLILGLSATGSSSAQTSGTVFIKYLGLSMHPHVGNDSPLFVRKLGESGRYVVNIGVVTGGDVFFVKDKVGVRLSVAALSDSRGAFAALAHVGPRFRLVKSNRFSLYGGIGPTLYFREDWNQKFTGYSDEGSRFSVYSDWQYIFAWYGGELEFNYRVSRRTDLSMTAVPGYPEIISFAFGVKQWF